MDALNCSVSRLNGAIGQKLGMLSESVSTSELSEIHSFLKEAKGLRETIMSMGTFEGSGESEYYEEEEDAGEIFFNSYIQACHVIVDMYLLLDDNKIKESKSEWVFEEVRAFMEIARETFGSRVPELPTMRMVSKPKKKAKAKAK